MAAKARQNARPDLEAGLACADAFRRLAEPLLPMIALDLPEGKVRTNVDLGDLVACAANLAFALEMYFKTLLALKAVEIPTTHDLGRLFDALPLRTQAYLGHSFKGHLRTRWVGRPATVTLAVGDPGTPAWSDHRRPMDLRSVLARSSNLFQDWRYVFEVSIPAGEQYQFHEFEYGALSSACSAIRSLFPDDAVSPGTQRPH